MRECPHCKCTFFRDNKCRHCGKRFKIIKNKKEKFKPKRDNGDVQYKPK